MKTTLIATVAAIGLFATGMTFTSVNPAARPDQDVVALSSGSIQTTGLNAHIASSENTHENRVKNQYAASENTHGAHGNNQFAASENTHGAHGNNQFAASENTHGAHGNNQFA